ncbi:MAG: D-alanyl-D-alanine carboxypeptidase [Candidatus Tectomicrobia bacterium]|uniref:D-alanyl-D-alanine carboxypeptidase n=1 Tax=Tectimicrobiota bacterium TaxID=2528274 RepID=A0A932GP79_UNCTE|nr:D-alanyl-D-alanine carboxypeptidase [Candidatus Tectomicrobia bacterium]
MKTLLLFLMVFLSVSTAFAHPPKKQNKPSRSIVAVPSAYKAAVVLDANSGEILYERNSHKRWPPASMTKMMVMLIALERIKEGGISLQDRVRISPNASQTGGRALHLQPRQMISLQDLLKAMIVTSANDAAVAVAEYIGDTTQNFTRIMNRRAAQLKMKETVFRTVSGLPRQRGRIYDLSTAYDMARLGRQLARHDRVLKWASQPAATVHIGKSKRTIANVNPLVRTYPGADGLKTGFTRRSGFNLTATARRGDMRVIAVVMGAPNPESRRRSAIRLLNLGFQKIDLVEKRDESSG